MTHADYKHIEARSWILTIAAVIITAAFFLGMALRQNYPDVIVGKKYLYTWERMDEKDPFEKNQIDTVIVVNIKNGYVQWTYPRYKDYQPKYVSSKLIDFQKQIQPL